MRRAGTLDLLKLKFVCPENDGTPHKLIQQNNERDHGGDAPQDGAGIAVACGGLQKRTQPWQTEVSFAKHEHFAGHQKKPPASDGNHGVPNEANRGERKIQLDKSLPPAKAINDGSLTEVAWNGFQRRIEAESDIPSLAGED